MGALRHYCITYRRSNCSVKCIRGCAHVNAHTGLHPINPAYIKKLFLIEEYPVWGFTGACPRMWDVGYI